MKAWVTVDNATISLKSRVIRLLSYCAIFCDYSGAYKFIVCLSDGRLQFICLHEDLSYSVRVKQLSDMV